MSEKTTDTGADTSKPRPPIEVFYSYSHKDEDLRDRLDTHLSLLRRTGVIEGWHDRRISAGQEWKGSVNEHLESAGIILLLVSSDFLASDYCYDKEMKRAMERHEERTARVIPVILRECDWSGAPFGKLQALPKDAKAIKLWGDEDVAFTDVAKGIKRAVEELSRNLTALPSKPGSTTTGPSLVSREPSRDMEDSARPVRPQENLEASAEARPNNTPVNDKKAVVDPTIQVADTTSRRTLIGVIITAGLATIGTIFAAGISKCGSVPQPGSSSQNFIGRIMNKNTEEKVRGAKVILEGESVPSVAYSDSEGVFSFPVNDPNKEIHLRIEANQYENFDLRIVPAKNQGIQDVRLTSKTDSAAELSGTVLDSNDRPIQGAKVTLDDVLPTRPVETSSDGVFSFKEIPRKYGEMVRVRVVKEGYQPNPYTEDVILGKSPPRIKLTRKR